MAGNSGVPVYGCRCERCQRARAGRVRLRFAVEGLPAALAALDDMRSRVERLAGVWQERHDG